jgi:hypothetical protein
VYREGSISLFVMLNVTKHLGPMSKILRFAQDDIMPGHIPPARESLHIDIQHVSHIICEILFFANEEEKII